jgi:hypothetical protein
MNKLPISRGSVGVPLALAMAVCVVCSPSQAARAVNGPWADLNAVSPVDWVNNDGCQPVRERTWKDGPEGHNSISDWVTVTCGNYSGYWENTTAARGVGYDTSDADGGGKGSVTIYTVYGMAPAQGDDGTTITGFDPTAPLTFSDETMSSMSKKVYKALPPVFVRIGDLQALLGTDFDLSPFAKGDPDSMVYVFKTSIPAKDYGVQTTGTLVNEDMSDAYHVGWQHDGSFGPGQLAGTRFTVDSGTVNVLGSLNGSNGMCSVNPSGNCIDVAGSTGAAQISTTPSFDLQPGIAYTISFKAASWDPKVAQALTVRLGSSEWDLKVSKAKKMELQYTPSTVEVGSVVTFASSGDLEPGQGPLLSGFSLCAQVAGTSTCK